MDGVQLSVLTRATGTSFWLDFFSDQTDGLGSDLSGGAVGLVKSGRFRAEDDGGVVSHQNSSSGSSWKKLPVSSAVSGDDIL
ncbi:hypothetical protein FQA47_003869 [Oryzias melastigma]|uniref:Uncharacterized protein n=1 Tax=Oryzias melastigma TaxID=30732 RepID=A0A834CJX6_ORYME|nr:hypothetical protein FQA47_003869 [Oryzias melastigma]